MIADSKPRNVDVLIVGAGLSSAACAKRLVDAGYETVILEKKELPRHKICSGILSPRGHRFLIENFGPLPSEILHAPTSCRGVTFHFPSMLSLSMDFNSGPTPHLHRKYSDYWAIRRSNGEVHERTLFIGLEDRGRYVKVSARKEDRTVEYRARFVIGADGPNSPVIRTIYPGYSKQIIWFMVGQKLLKIIECPLDEEYFHFWFHPDLGYYTWSHARDTRQIVGVGFLRGGSFNERHKRFVDYLNYKHHVKLDDDDKGEACLENFGLSLTNRYVFGKGNVIITGQAAGFLNMMAEGMSCALHSGAISGEAAIEAFRYNQPIQQVYRAMIRSEVRRCSDQWNPLQIVFGHPHEAEFRVALKNHRPCDRVTILREILRFIRIYAPFKWGRRIMGQTVYRQFHGRYSSSQWL